MSSLAYDYEDRYGRVVNDPDDTTTLIAVRPVTAGEVAAGRPLVVADYSVRCDAPGSVEHWHTITTDGARVITDAGARYVEREGTQISIGCGMPHGCSSSTCDDACDGTVVIDLADSDAWRAANDDDARMLTSYGEQVTS